MALCVRYAQPFAIAYASIQPHRLSHNNIMLNSQYHSHFDKMEAVFSPTAQPPNATHPDHPFQRCRKKLSISCWWQCAIKGSFISVPFRYSVSLRYTTFHYITLPFISPFILHRTARVFPHSILQNQPFAFRVLAFALPTLQCFLCWYNLQKTQ